MSYDKKKTPVLTSEEGYALYADFYDKDQMYLDSIDRGFLAFSAKHLEGKKVLDVGCGTGRNTIRLAEAGVDITGMDICKEMLEKLNRKKPGIKTKLGDILEIPYEDESFDAVICNLVFVHLKNPVLAIREIYRVLKNDGELYLSVIHQRRPPVLKAKKEKFKINSFFYSARKIFKLLEEEEFGVVDMKTVEDQGWEISTFFRARK